MIHSIYFLIIKIILIYKFCYIICPQFENVLASFTYSEAPTPGWTIFHQLLPAAERPTIQQIVNEGKGHHDRCYEEVSDRQRHDEEVADLPEVAVRVDG